MDLGHHLPGFSTLGMPRLQSSLAVQHKPSRAGMQFREPAWHPGCRLLFEQPHIQWFIVSRLHSGLRSTCHTLLLTLFKCHRGKQCNKFGKDQNILGIAFELLNSIISHFFAVLFYVIMICPYFLICQHIYWYVVVAIAVVAITCWIISWCSLFAISVISLFCYLQKAWWFSTCSSWCFFRWAWNCAPKSSCSMYSLRISIVRCPSSNCTICHPNQFCDIII